MSFIVCFAFSMPSTTKAATISPERAALIQQLQSKLLLLLTELQNLQLAGKTQSLDIKVAGRDDIASYTGKRSQTFTWTSTGVQNCHLLVAQGNQYDVPTSGSKTLTLDGTALYVVLSCNSIATGEALNDYIYLTPAATFNPETVPRGNPNGKAALSVYTDLDCPFCKMYHETLSKLLTDSTHKSYIRWVYKPFPIDQLHPNASALAEATYCVGELGGGSAYWKFIDSIFSLRGVNEQTDMTQLDSYATSAGVNVEKFEACRASHRYSDTIAKSVAAGADLGVQGTPTSFLPDGSMISGAQPYSAVDQAIGEYLQK